MLLPSEVIEQGWTKGVAARDLHGGVVDPFNSNAHCWCAGASIEYALENRTITRYNYMDKILSKIKPYHTIASWNDSPFLTKQKVIQLLQEVEKEMRLT